MRITVPREEARGEKVVNWLRKQRKILSDHQVHQRGGKLPWPLFSLFRPLKTLYFLDDASQRTIRFTAMIEESRDSTRLARIASAIYWLSKHPPRFVESWMSKIVINRELKNSRNGCDDTRDLFYYAPLSSKT